MNFHKKKQDINFCGLARSGNHAIILWYLNNIAPAVGLKPPNQENFKTQVYHDPATHKYIYFNNVSRAGYGGFDKHILEHDMLIYSWEDLDLDINNTYYICRDFLNLVASRNKKFKTKDGMIPHTPKGKGYVETFEEMIKLWIKYHMNPKKNIIKYNSWLVSKTYRDECARNLGIKNDVDNITTVSSIGEGSSFVGTQLDKTENYIKRYELVSFSEMQINAMLKNSTLIQMNKDFYDIDMKAILCKKQ